MNINKKNFFWYVLTSTAFLVIIYFLFFSGKIYQYKFVHNKITGNEIIKSFNDYKILKEGMDLYRKLYSKEIIKLDHFDYHAKRIFSNIIRFTQTNKNYKYEYKNFKELSPKEFKTLEKIINNVSLEGAYFLNPEHIDKVTVNLFLSKKNHKVIFLDYYKYIINNEVDKYFQNLASIQENIGIETNYVNHVSEINMIREFHYDFLFYVRSIIYGEKTNTNANKFYSFNKNEELFYLDIDEILNYLECPYYHLGTKKVSCSTLTDEIVKKITNFYLNLNSINVLDIRTFDNDTKFDNFVMEAKERLNFDSKSFIKKNSLFEELFTRWIIRENYNLEPFFFMIQKGFSEDYIKKIKHASLLRDRFNLLDNNFDYAFINSKNYDLDQIKEDIFSNLDEVEFNRNYLELLPYLSFALIFSIVSHIVYRSFSDK